MANIAPSFDHLTYEALVNCVLGSGEQPTGAQRALLRTAIGTINTAILAQDAAYLPPGGVSLTDRINIRFP